VYGLPFIHPFTKARRRDGAPKPAAQPAVHRPQIKEHSMSDKKEDLVGPGIGDLELEKILPDDYSSLLSLKRVAEGALRGGARKRTFMC